MALFKSSWWERGIEKDDIISVMKKYATIINITYIYIHYFMFSLPFKRVRYFMKVSSMPSGPSCCC